MKEIMEVEDKIKVVDEAVEENRESASIFTISSHGADYPAQLIAERVRDEVWYVPNFQRNLVWTLKDASRFIESLLLGLPVPGIFLFKEIESGKYSIIDGQQRCESIRRFIHEGEFNGKIFKLTGVRDEYKGKKFSELSVADQTRLKDAFVHATIFQQITPSKDKSSVYEVFERINTGGSKLSAQEIRTCVNFGSFVKLLEKVNHTPGWDVIYPNKSKRLKDHEMILRFLAFRNPLNKYKKGLRKYLDDFMEHYRDIDEPQEEVFLNQFTKMSDFVAGKIGNQAFRTKRYFNAAVYDSTSVAVSVLLDSGDIPDFKKRYDRLLSDDIFLDLIRTSTADADRVEQRFTRALQVLSGNA